MKLKSSKLCVNCESIYEEIGPCPFCGSEIVVWMSSAMGTILEPTVEGIDPYTLAMKENPESRKHSRRSDSPAVSFGQGMMENKSIAEFRNVLGRFGKEMVRVLTFGIIQA